MNVLICSSQDTVKSSRGLGGILAYQNTCVHKLKGGVYQISVNTPSYSVLEVRISIELCFLFALSTFEFLQLSYKYPRHNQEFVVNLSNTRY